MNVKIYKLNLINNLYSNVHFSLYNATVVILKTYKHKCVYIKNHCPMSCVVMIIGRWLETYSNSMCIWHCNYLKKNPKRILWRLNTLDQIENSDVHGQIIPVTNFAEFVSRSFSCLYIQLPLRETQFCAQNSKMSLAIFLNSLFILPFRIIDVID